MNITPTTVAVARGRDLVPATVFERVAARVRADEGIPADRAERIVDQALAFLRACALREPGAEPLAPSRPVDAGWHAFVLHTREYAAFCELYAGRFIHHVPDDGPRPGGPHVTAAVRAIEASGFHVDRELWEPTGATCSQCHAGCSDSPAV